MIPKASQRGGGQDLATHLLNAVDNEYVELADVRGAVAGDLHGAFAEWEAIASALTKSRNYLYSLSINPHVVNGPLTRDQYADYADRVEKALGLSGQPRAMVMHIKDGREHCHVIWSRVDAQAGKAIHMAFDHQKLMMVTREFARDHGLKLPAGYERNAQEQERNRQRQLSLYEKEQERQTGISKQAHIDLVTAAWKRSDNAKAFVRALEDMGYVLATGDKRPYVLVDLYGGMNALPKLIADKEVRTKGIRAFLEKDFPAEALPTVDEARALVAQHRQAQEDFARAQRDDRQLEQLKAAQALRRAQAVADRAALDAGQKIERFTLSEAQRLQRLALKRAYVAEARRVRDARERARPTGLAAFLGRVTGVNLVIRQVQRHRDTKRLTAYRDERMALVARQQVDTAIQKQRHILQAFDADRALRALDQVDQRELKSFETKQVRAERTKQRGESGKMPALALALELKPRGRTAAPHKAVYRYRKRDRAKDEPPLATPAPERPETKPEPTAKEDFTRAAAARIAVDADRGDGSGKAPHDDLVDHADHHHDQDADAPGGFSDHTSASSPGAHEPHGTAPLADEFGKAAREQEAESGEADTIDIRPSRAARRSERERDKGNDRDDFERER